VALWVVSWFRLIIRFVEKTTKFFRILGLDLGAGSEERFRCGTANTVDYARKLGRSVLVIDPVEQTEKWIVK